MAFLDKNNGGSYSNSDPLDELDRELAELKRTLGKLDDSAAKPEADANRQPPEDDAYTNRPETSAGRTGNRDPEPAADNYTYPAESPVSEETGRDNERLRRPYEPEPSGGDDSGEPIRSRVSPPRQREREPVKKKKSKAPTVIIILLLIAGVLLIAGWAVKRYLPFFGFGSPIEITGDEKTVTINDSEMGSFEFTPVEGAETNAYTKQGLATESGDVLAYYENDQKISHLGVDISEFQGDVDFQAMKDAGVEFVMLRIGGRFYGDKSSIYEDGSFDAYYEQADAAGLKVGAYFFSQAISAEDAREEANFAINKLNGRKLGYPIAFDWENIEGDEARTDNINGDQLTAIAEAFCDTVNEAGYKSIVYSNASQMFIMYDFETMKDYDFWLADYREFPTMYYKFDMWQYTKEGAIAGVEGKVDLNLSFTDFSE